MTDAFNATMDARSPGVPNSEDGLDREVKTTLDEELFAEFLIAAGPAGGRARVLRDLICLHLHDLTYDEHVAKRRRAQHFGKGRRIAHATPDADMVPLRVAGEVGAGDRTGAR